MNVELVKIRRFAMQAIEFRFIISLDSLLIGIVISSCHPYSGLVITIVIIMFYCCFYSSAVSGSFYRCYMI